MQVMVATDGTDAAIDAARQAIGLLRPDARITLVTVVVDREDPEQDAGGFEGPLLTPEQADRDYAEHLSAGQEALERTQAALERTAAALGDHVEVLLIPSDEEAGLALIHHAEQHHPDLLVIGAGGKGVLRRLFTGSVSDHVVHKAPCPVLVVRHHDASEALSSSDPPPTLGL